MRLAASRRGVWTRIFVWRGRGSGRLLGSFWGVGKLLGCTIVLEDVWWQRRSIYQVVCMTLLSCVPASSSAGANLGSSGNV